MNKSETPSDMSEDIFIDVFSIYVINYWLFFCEFANFDYKNIKIIADYYNIVIIICKNYIFLIESFLQEEKGSRDNFSIIWQFKNNFVSLQQKRNEDETRECFETFAEP